MIVAITLLGLFTNHSEQQLLLLLGQGSDAAFAELYNRHAPKVMSIAYSKLNSLEGAEEIVQEIFLNLWERRESLTIESLPNYLAVAVKYQVINYIKKKISIEKHSDYVRALAKVATDETSETIALMGLSEAFEKGIRRLPEKTQIIFKLSRMEHKSIAEIANELNLSQQAIKYHITQSLKEMRLYLKEYILFAGLLAILHYMF
jgi:RNA polymerase sigma-70 factor (family 1)